jgi:MATE family multidrug resistance protein
MDSRAGSYRQVWDLAYPAIVALISQTIMWTVDAAMVGHVGKTELAAVGLGGLMVWTIYSFFLGLANSLNTYVAQSSGSGDYARCSKYFWQGIYIALAAGAALFVIREFNPLIIELLGPAEAVKELGLRYVDIRMFGAPFMMLYFTFSNFFRGIGDTRTPMKIVAFANLANIVLDYLLIFGKGPFPAMGVAGAAWATFIANVLSATIFTLIIFSPYFKKTFEIHKHWRPDISELRRLLRIGLPIGLHFFLDMGSFLVFSAYIGRMGTEPLAANQITIQILALSFMPCQGFAIAATTLVGQYIGAERRALARKSAYATLRLGLLYSGVVALMYVIFPEYLVRIFNSDPTVIMYGKQIIMLAAVFQVFDAVQMIASGALRGAGDTKVPMLFAIGGAWLLFLPISFVLGTLARGGATGAWAGATLYIIFLGSAMFLRLRRGQWTEMRI